MWLEKNHSQKIKDALESRFSLAEHVSLHDKFRFEKKNLIQGNDKKTHMQNPEQSQEVNGRYYPEFE